MTIAAWYNTHKVAILAMDAIPEDVRLALSVGMPNGIYDHGRVLRGADRDTVLARFLRFGNSPLIHLRLPEAHTADRHRLIRDAILGEGGMVVTVPLNVIDAAEIMGDTIEVIDTLPTKHPVRADDQLIRAKVLSPVWEPSMSGGWSLASYENRDTYFLSGYDANEKGLSYFFCELPAGVKPTTVAEAYETLKPPSVKAAEELGVEVRRQGDMFFIRMESRHSKMSPGWEYLHGSNHRAEFVRTTGSLLYVSGSIVHAPSERPADHAPLELGQEHWWLCVRNTVPIVRSGRP